MASSSSEGNDISEATIDSSLSYGHGILESDEEEEKPPSLDLGAIEPYMYEPVASESDTESDCEHKDSTVLERRSGIELSVFIMHTFFCTILHCCTYLGVCAGQYCIAMSTNQEYNLLL